MTPELILFLALALIAVATALGMLFSRNAIYSALFLVLNFITVAVFYLLLGAPFIAMAKVTVYAGAIMVLFLFVIMLLGAERLRPRRELAWQTPLAGFLAVVLVAAGVGFLAVGQLRTQERFTQRLEAESIFIFREVAAEMAGRLRSDPVRGCARRDGRARTVTRECVEPPRSTLGVCRASDRHHRFLRVRES